MTSNFAKIIICIVIIVFLVSCQSAQNGIAPVYPTSEVQISTVPYLTETPIPTCVVFSGIELSVELLSENSVHIRITGLAPNETVNAIFSSKIEAHEREITVSGPADEKGVFEYSVGLRGRNVDTEFKDWKIRVVHSKGSTCTEVSLP